MNKNMLICAAIACTLATNAVAPVMTAYAAPTEDAAYVEVNHESDLPIIIPHSNIGQDSSVNSKGTYVSSTATASKGDGKYIRFYFKNTGNNTCTVSLEKKKLFSWTKAGSFKVDSGKQGQDVYESGSETGKYRLRIEASDGGNITGAYNIAQYVDKP